MSSQPCIRRIKIVIYFANTALFLSVIKAEALREKYADISTTYHFLPVGIETSVVFGMEVRATVENRSSSDEGAGKIQVV